MFRMTHLARLLFLATSLSNLFGQTPETTAEDIEVCVSVVNRGSVSVSLDIREFRSWKGEFAPVFKNGCARIPKGTFSYRVQISGFQSDAGLIRGEAVLFSEKAKLTLFFPGDLGELAGKPVSIPVGTLEVSGRLKGPGARLVTSISLVSLFQNQGEPVEVRPDSDGNFAIRNVYPGSYVLVAFQSSTPLITQSIRVNAGSGRRIERDLEVPAAVNRE